MRGKHSAPSGCRRFGLILLLIVLSPMLALPPLLVISIVTCQKNSEYASRSGDYSYDYDEPSGAFFDADGFSLVGERFAYTEGDLVVDKTGIDVSDHQGTIDWEAVAADGIRFAFIRIGFRGTTEGRLYSDQLYYDNLNEAHAAGIECGVYFFSQATTVEEAREEAELTLQLLDDMPLEYPVVFDHEPLSGERARNLGYDESNALAKEFCSVVEDGGYSAMIYGNCYDLDRLDSDVLDNYQIWVAEYDSQPSYGHSFSVWQYTSDGRVDGVSGPVDINLDLSEALSANA